MSDSHSGRLSGGCSSMKPRYDTEEKARVAAITAGKRAGIKLSYYSCEQCNGYHLTKSVGGKNPKL
jgi:hypothetical protein